MRNLVGRTGTRLVFLIQRSNKMSSRTWVFVVSAGLISLILFIVWLPHSNENGDMQRVTGAARVLAQQMKDYEAVLGRQSPLPPHGSPARGAISSLYGMRVHPRSGHWKMHHGIDLAISVGSPVMVTADGWVSRVDEDPDGYGIFVDVVHPASRYLTRYAHLSEVYVRPGEPVRRGRIIARSGNSGNSVGPHLHYEIRTATGHSVDPLKLRIP